MIFGGYHFLSKRKHLQSSKCRVTVPGLQPFSKPAKANLEIGPLCSWGCGWARTSCWKEKNRSPTTLCHSSSNKLSALQYRMVPACRLSVPRAQWRWLSFWTISFLHEPTMQRCSNDFPEMSLSSLCCRNNINRLFLPILMPAPVRVLSDAWHWA